MGGKPSKRKEEEKEEKCQMTESLITSANNLLRKAVGEEKNKNYELAISLYEQGLALFNHVVIYSQLNIAQKESTREKVKEFADRLDKLKETAKEAVKKKEKKKVESDDDSSDGHRSKNRDENDDDEHMASLKRAIKTRRRRRQL